MVTRIAAGATPDAYSQSEFDTDKADAESAKEQALKAAGEVYATAHATAAGARQQVIAAANSAYAASKTAADQTLVDARGAENETYEHTVADREKQRAETNAGLQAAYDKQAASTRATKFSDLATTTPSHFATLFSGMASLASDFVDSAADAIADLKSDFAEHDRVYAQGQATDDKTTSSTLTAAANTFTTAVTSAFTTAADSTASLLNNLAALGAHLPILPSVATAPTVVMPEVSQVTVDHFDDYSAPTQSATYTHTFDDILAEQQDWSSLIAGISASDPSTSQQTNSTATRLTADRLDNGLVRDDVKSSRQLANGFTPDELRSLNEVKNGLLDTAATVTHSLFDTAKTAMGLITNSFVDPFKHVDDKGPEIQPVNLGIVGSMGRAFLNTADQVLPTSSRLIVGSALAIYEFASVSTIRGQPSGSVLYPMAPTRGTWEFGTPGHGWYWPAAKDRFQEAIYWSRGKPDFQSAGAIYETDGKAVRLKIKLDDSSINGKTAIEVERELKARHKRDLAKANQRFKEKFGYNLPNDVLEEYTWHHKYMDGTMELVLTDAHDAAKPHKGGNGRHVDRMFSNGKVKIGGRVVSKGRFHRMLSAEKAGPRSKAFGGKGNAILIGAGVLWGLAQGESVADVMDGLIPEILASGIGGISQMGDAEIRHPRIPGIFYSQKSEPERGPMPSESYFRAKGRFDKYNRLFDLQEIGRALRSLGVLENQLYEAGFPHLDLPTPSPLRHENPWTHPDVHQFTDEYLATASTRWKYFVQFQLDSPSWAQEHYGELVESRSSIFASAHRAFLDQQIRQMELDGSSAREIEIYKWIWKYQLTR